MKKKSELKEITLKSKLAKTVPKQELPKQYDEYVVQKAIQQKPRPDPESKIESEESEEETVIVTKLNKKSKRKVYLNQNQMKKLL
jgi:hypothetical protein